ncbi:MAG: tRNA-dihydrouridine synthase, partial [Cyanobium sp.]
MAAATTTLSFGSGSGLSGPPAGGGDASAMAAQRAASTEVADVGRGWRFGDASARPSFAEPLRLSGAGTTRSLRCRVLQSPLAGVSDRIFRNLVRRWAPDALLFTEMVNATSLELG